MGDNKKKRFAVVAIENVNINYGTNVLVLDDTIRCHSKKKRSLDYWLQLDEDTKKNIVLSDACDGTDNSSSHICDICFQKTNTTIQLLHHVATKCQELRHFCGKCISLWIYQNKGQPACPVCRQDIMYRNPYPTKVNTK